MKKKAFFLYSKKFRGAPRRRASPPTFISRPLPRAGASIDLGANSEGWNFSLSVSAILFPDLLRWVWPAGSSQKLPLLKRNFFPLRLVELFSRPRYGFLVAPFWTVFSWNFTPRGFQKTNGEEPPRKRNDGYGFFCFVFSTARG